MLKKRLNKIIVFFMVLVTVMNVSVVFDNLANGHFLEFGQEAKAVVKNYFTFSCSESIPKDSPDNGKYVTAKFDGNGDISIVDSVVSGSVTFKYNLQSAYVRNTINSFYVRVDRGGEGLGVNYPGYFSTYYLDGTSGDKTLSFRFYLDDPLSTYDNLKFTIYIDYCSSYKIDYDYIVGAERVINFAENKPYISNGNNPPTITKISLTEKETLSKNYFPSMTVSDPDSDMVCKYYVDSILKGTATASNTDQQVFFDVLDTGTLKDGEHIFKFEVSDGKDAPVSQSVVVRIHNYPPAISPNTSFTSDETSITISGSASDSITKEESLKYKYTVQDTSGKNVGDKVPNFISAKSLKIASLLPNTLYNAKFEVMDEAGNIAKIEKQIYTKAQTPQISINKDSIKENSMELQINDSNPATTKYQLMMNSSYVTGVGTLTSSPEWITTTNKKITVTGLTQNMQYTIKAKSINSEAIGVETAFSTQITGTTLSQPPANINLVKGINSIKITWNAVSGATGYDLEIDGSSNPLELGTSLSYTHSGLQADKPHLYRVRVKNAGGNGPWSKYLGGSALPNPPETPKITDTKTTQTTVTISWNAVANASGYEVEADGEPIATDSKTTYTDEGLNPDSLHKYRVRAKNAGGESEWSAVTEISTLPIPPEVPANLKGKPTRDNITLTWEATERAEGYYIEMDGSNREVKLVTSYIFEGLTANSSHTYRIRAWNRGGKSDWSSYQTITTWPEIPPTPNNIMATAETDAITVTWYSSAYAESYDLQVDENKTVNVKETSYTNKGLLPGTKHTYKIRAKNISGDGLWSKLVEISTLPQENTTTNESAILANIAAVVTNKSVTLAWQAVTSNAQYEVEVDGVVSDNGKETVYNHTGLEPVSFHTYRIRTKDVNGNGEWCAVLALSTLPNLPGAPSNVNAIAANTQIKLSWTKEESIAYEVEVDGKVVNAGEVAGYIDNGLKPGTAHTYRVRGKNITGVTAWSDSITKSTTSPSYEVECTKDMEFDFSLLASNVQDFGGINFVVTYNPKELEVIDLCEYTADKDTTTNGKISGTNILVKCTEGRLEFAVDESITAGTTWSGEITTIVFKPKIDGKVSINYSIE